MPATCASGVRELQMAGGARRPAKEVEGAAGRDGGVEAARQRQRRARQWCLAAGSWQPADRMTVPAAGLTAFSSPPRAAANREAV